MRRRLLRCVQAKVVKARELGGSTHLPCYGKLDAWGRVELCEVPGQQQLLEASSLQSLINSANSIIYNGVRQARTLSRHLGGQLWPPSEAILLTFSWGHQPRKLFCHQPLLAMPCTRSFMWDTCLELLPSFLWFHLDISTTTLSSYFSVWFCQSLFEK